MAENTKASVLVDGVRLKADRKGAGFTQASFAEACGSVSVVTVRRAEQGKRVIATYLRRMAETLDQPVERYVIEDALAAATEYVVSLEGEWSGFFIEADRGELPYVVQEDIVLRQRGAVLEGTYHVHGPNEYRAEILRDGRVINNVIMGMLHQTTFKPPSGTAYFVQMASRDTDWLEGFTTWYDGDTGKTETTRMISVRKHCRGYLQYVREARRIMENERRMYRLRNLTEQGYDFDEAVAMVQATAARRDPGGRRRLSDRPGGLRIEGAEYLVRTGLSFEDLVARLIELDYLALGETRLDANHEGSVEQWAPIFRAFPDYWRLATRGDEIVAYWHLLPLTPQRMAEARRGRLVDSTLAPRDVLAPDRPGRRSVYIAMIASLPDYRLGISFRTMFDALVDLAETLALGGVFIDEVVFAAWSPMARRLGRRLGFERIAWLNAPDGAAPEPPVPVLGASFAEMLAGADFDRYPSLRAVYDQRPG